MATDTVTYVYCVVAAKRRPVIASALKGLPGTGRVRLLDVDAGLFAAVADAPRDRYSAAAIRRGLSDLEWVSRAAVGHERVVESFIGEAAVLPMKLFTIFTSEARTIEHVRSQGGRIQTLVKRVANHQEWGVRVTLDRSRAVAKASTVQDREASGAAYLVRKKKRRDAAIELVAHARETVAALYDRLAARSRLAKRRPAGELSAQGGPMLLDAAFLVPRARAASFRALVTRDARALARGGYSLTISGPWPPYTFVED
jgi:hypothetical protein